MPPPGQGGASRCLEGSIFARRGQELAAALAAQDLADEAEAAAYRALAEAATAFGARDATLDPTLRLLAGVLTVQGRDREAASLLGEVVEIRTSAYGARDPETTRALAELTHALVRARAPEAASAVRRMREALGKSKLLGEEKAAIARRLDSDRSLHG
jgi:hypothetical protein